LPQDKLVGLFKNWGVSLCEEVNFTPHMTLMKLTKSSFRKKGKILLEEIDLSYFKSLLKNNFKIKVSKNLTQKFTTHGHRTTLAAN